MKRYVSFFLLSVLLTAIIIIYFKDEGAINIVWLGYEINLSVATALSLLLLVYFLYKYLNQVTCWLSGLFSQSKAIIYRFTKGKSSQEELLTLARSSLETNLWQDARAYLMLLLKKKPDPEIYQLLAILELRENHDSKAAVTWLEKGLTETLSYPSAMR